MTTPNGSPSRPMSRDEMDLTPQTEREVRLCREAVKQTVAELHRMTASTLLPTGYALGTFAARLFPMPAVRVPRVVRVGDFEHRVYDGKPQWRYAASDAEPSRDSDGWCPLTASPIDAATLYDLLTSPTLTVPADDPRARAGEVGRG